MGFEGEQKWNSGNYMSEPGFVPEKEENCYQSTCEKDSNNHFATTCTNFYQSYNIPYFDAEPCSKAMAGTATTDETLTNTCNFNNREYTSLI